MESEAAQAGTAGALGAALGIAGFAVSIVSLIANVLFHHFLRKASVKQNLGYIVQIEKSLENTPSAFRFHGITPTDIAAAGVTEQELAYLVASCTSGGIYHESMGASGSVPFERNSYRYNMCCTEDFRRAWPLVKRMMNKNKHGFVAKVDLTISQIEKEIDSHRPA